MYKFLSWFATVIFLIPFLTLLGVFELIERFCFKFFGYQGLKKSLDLLQFLILTSLRLTAYRLHVKGEVPDLPKDTPVIIVSNHQSIFDIPFILWTFRRYHPKFVAKKELSRGIPGVSFYLHHGGNIMIDRKDREQATQAIADLGKYISEHKRGAIIYPEGSRSRDGHIKPFKPLGLITLLENAPDAIIIPIAIDNAWRLVKYGLKPIPFGIKCQLTILPPLNPKEYELSEIPRQLELQIAEALGQSVAQESQSS